MVGSRYSLWSGLWSALSLDTALMGRAMACFVRPIMTGRDSAWRSDRPSSAPPESGVVRDGGYMEQLQDQDVAAYIK